MLAQFLNEQLVSIFLVVGFFLRLKSRSRITDRRMRHFYTAVFCCALLIMPRRIPPAASGGSCFPPSGIPSARPPR